MIGNLDSALFIAGSSVANINRQLAVLGQNVANAGTPSYATEVATQTSLDAGGQGIGVQTGKLTRTISDSLQSALTAQNADTAGLTTRQSALAQIDTVQGTPGAGADLSALLGKLGDAFSSLQGDPSSQPGQRQAVSAAQTLATQINALSAGYAQVRQAAQDGIVSGVTAANTTLATIGALSGRIVAAKAAGTDSADLENQRDAAVSQLSQLVAITTNTLPNGDLQVFTRSGLSLPTSGGSPLATAPATVGPQASYPGALPAVTLGGADVTGSLGGQVGANVTLRDHTLPIWQAQLDEFSESLSTRFANQGLSLFTDPTGAVPAGGGLPVQSGYVGYATTVQVNPAILANPALVRDGTNAIAGSATGASAFTPNPAGGPAGFTTLIARVIDYALGSQAQSGVAQPAPNTAGLGPAGTLSAGFPAPAALGDFAAAVVGAQASDSAAAASAATSATAVRTSLQTSLASSDGVSIDRQLSMMVQLQNTYGATARVISAVQQMYATLQQAIQ